MRYKDKEIWIKTPRVNPKITINSDYNLIGNNKQSKWNIAPVSRNITHSYFIKDLKELREYESFFISCKGRFNSFFITTFKRVMRAKKQSSSVSYFSAISANRAFWMYGQSRYILIDRKFATKIVDVKKDELGDEVIIIEDALPFQIDENSLIEELIAVRFNMDEIEFSKKGAVGYELQLDFKEVFYE